MKSKHRETLHRNPKCRIYSKVKIPFYVSPKTLREVLLSELECAKPDSNATVLDSPPVSSLCRRTCTAFAAQPGSEPKSRWAGDEWEEWDGLMVPPSPAGRILCLHPTTLFTLGLHCHGGGGQDSSQVGFTKSQGQPLFHENTAYSQIHTVLASLHQRGHREMPGPSCFLLGFLQNKSNCHSWRANTARRYTTNLANILHIKVSRLTNPSPCSAQTSIMETETTRDKSWTTKHVEKQNMGNG